MAYAPEPLQNIGTLEALREYLDRELRNISKDFTLIEQGRYLQTLHNPPAKPRDGTIVLADGVNWNPGDGAGIYLFDAEDANGPSWVKLVKSGGRGDFGWKDEKNQLLVRGVGANDPTWMNITGNFFAFAFSPTIMNQAWGFFHIDHDYALGTPVYPHVHWLPRVADTGTVRWGFEYALAKGHGQQSFNFGSPTTFYVEQAASAASLYRHYIGEASDAQAIPATDLEPDTVVMIRIFRDATHVNDTFTGNAMTFYADLHYQVGPQSTKNKAPNFYLG